MCKKYIVELKELPENCTCCPLLRGDYDISEYWCGVTEEQANESERGNLCPIKTIE